MNEKRVHGVQRVGRVIPNPPRCAQSELLAASNRRVKDNAPYLGA